MAARDCRKLCFFSHVSRELHLPLLAHSTAGVSGHQPGSVVTTADVNATPSISWQGALWKGARAAWSEAQLLTSAPCALLLQRRGNPEVARWAGLLQMAAQCPAASARGLCHRRDESLQSPPAAGQAVATEAPRSFKNRWYLVINEVLKMRYKRLNCLSQLLGPYVYENIYLCFN